MTRDLGPPHVKPATYRTLVKENLEAEVEGVKQGNRKEKQKN